MDVDLDVTVSDYFYISEVQPLKVQMTQLSSYYRQDDRACFA